MAAVIGSGRSTAESARAHAVSWWLVQAAINAVAVVLPDVNELAVRRLGIDEDRHRSVRWSATTPGPGDGSNPG